MENIEGKRAKRGQEGLKGETRRSREEKRDARDGGARKRRRGAAWGEDIAGKKETRRQQKGAEERVKSAG